MSYSNGYKCAFCEKLFWAEVRLLRHQRDTGHDGSSELFKCSCGKAFGRSSMFEEHTAKTKHQTHVCAVAWCGKTFWNEAGLRRHERDTGHTNEYGGEGTPMRNIVSGGEDGAMGMEKDIENEESSEWMQEEEEESAHHSPESMRKSNHQSSTTSSSAYPCHHPPAPPCAKNNIYTCSCGKSFGKETMFREHRYKTGHVLWDDSKTHAHKKRAKNDRKPKSQQQQQNNNNHIPPPSPFLCSCGKSFGKEISLRAHEYKTGHRNNLKKKHHFNNTNHHHQNNPHSADDAHKRRGRGTHNNGKYYDNNNNNTNHTPSHHPLSSSQIARAPHAAHAHGQKRRVYTENAADKDKKFSVCTGNGDDEEDDDFTASNASPPITLVPLNSSSSSSLECPVCNATFGSRSAVLMHQEYTGHDTTSPSSTTCPSSSMEFSGAHHGGGGRKNNNDNVTPSSHGNNNSNALMHRHKHRGSLLCTCGILFNDKRQFKVHRRDTGHLPVCRFRCEFCYRTFDGEVAGRMHQEYSGHACALLSRVYTCACCELVFTAEHEYAQHPCSSVMSACHTKTPQLGGDGNGHKNGHKKRPVGNRSENIIIMGNSEHGHKNDNDHHDHHVHKVDDNVDDKDNNRDEEEHEDDQGDNDTSCAHHHGHHEDGHDAEQDDGDKWTEEHTGDGDEDMGTSGIQRPPPPPPLESDREEGDGASETAASETEKSHQSHSTTPSTCDPCVRRTHVVSPAKATATQTIDESTSIVTDQRTALTFALQCTNTVSKPKKKKKSKAMEKKTEDAFKNGNKMQENKFPYMVFVGGLPNSITTPRLRTFFEKYGTVVHCVVVRFHGFGFVTFSTRAEMYHALSKPWVQFEYAWVEVKPCDPKKYKYKDVEEIVTKTKNKPASSPNANMYFSDWINSSDAFNYFYEYWNALSTQTLLDQSLRQRGEVEALTDVDHVKHSESRQNNTTRNMKETHFYCSKCDSTMDTDVRKLAPGSGSTRTTTGEASSPRCSRGECCALKEEGYEDLTNGECESFAAGDGGTAAHGKSTSMTPSSHSQPTHASYAAAPAWTAGTETTTPLLSPKNQKGKNNKQYFRRKKGNSIVSSGSRVHHHQQHHHHHHHHHTEPRSSTHCLSYQLPSSAYDNIGGDAFHPNDTDEVHGITLADSIIGASGMGGAYHPWFSTAYNLQHPHSHTSHSMNSRTAGAAHTAAQVNYCKENNTSELLSYCTNNNTSNNTHAHRHNRSGSSTSNGNMTGHHNMTEAQKWLYDAYYFLYPEEEEEELGNDEDENEIYRRDMMNQHSEEYEDEFPSSSSNAHHHSSYPYGDLTVMTHDAYPNNGSRRARTSSMTMSGRGEAARAYAQATANMGKPTDDDEEEEGAKQMNKEKWYDTMYNVMWARQVSSEGPPAGGDIWSIVRPRDILFTKALIKPHFSCGQSIVKTLDALRQRQITIEKIPKIDVRISEGKFWAYEGNRRLWMYRQLESEGRLPHGIEIRLAASPMPYTVFPINHNGLFARMEVEEKAEEGSCLCCTSPPPTTS